MSKLVRLSIALMTAIVLLEAQVAASKPAAKPTKTVSSKPAKVKQAKPNTVKVTKASKPAKAPKSSGTLAAKATRPAKATKPAKVPKAPATLQPVGPEMNSKLQKKLGEDSKHAARMAAKLSLPDGITIQQAAAGFKNFGQFNAAVNLSNRLGIPFNDVKAAMTGWTLPNVYSGDATKTTIGTMSLGQTQQAYKAGTLPTYPSPETAPTAAGTSVPTISGNGV